jgi:hypothetical protein
VCGICIYRDLEQRYQQAKADGSFDPFRPRNTREVTQHNNNLLQDLCAAVATGVMPNRFQAMFRQRSAAPPLASSKELEDEARRMLQPLQEAIDQLGEAGVASFNS